MLIRTNKTRTLATFIASNNVYPWILSKCQVWGHRTKLRFYSLDSLEAVISFIIKHKAKLLRLKVLATFTHLRTAKIFFKECIFSLSQVLQGFFSVPSWVLVEKAIDILSFTAYYVGKTRTHSLNGLKMLNDDYFSQIFFSLSYFILSGIVDQIF